MYAVTTSLRFNPDVLSLTDENLVKTIVATNDTSLFEILYIRYEKMVYNKCLGFSKGDYEAQDLTQDIFLNLFVKLNTFKGESKFSTWLYSITYNHCVNYVNRDPAKRIEKTSVDLKNLDYVSYETQDDDLIYQLRIDKLKVASEFISPEEKIILLLKYQDSLSIKELASLFDLGESAVKMRLKRAKQKLIKAYSKQGVIEPAYLNSKLTACA